MCMVGRGCVRSAPCRWRTARLGSAAALPGGAARACWHVCVCVYGAGRGRQDSTGTIVVSPRHIPPGPHRPANCLAKAAPRADRAPLGTYVPSPAQRRRWRAPWAIRRPVRPTSAPPPTPALLDRPRTRCLGLSRTQTPPYCPERCPWLRTQWRTRLGRRPTNRCRCGGRQRTAFKPLLVARAD